MVPGRKYTIPSALRILWSGRYVIAIAIALGLASTSWYVSRIPNVYRSQATIIALPQLVPQNYVKSTVTLNLEDRLRALTERVISEESLTRAAKELNVYPELAADPAEAARRMRGVMGVELVRVDAFRVSFMHRDPVRAARVTQWLANRFVEENGHERTGLAEETNDFVDGQLERTRQQLAQQEQRLEAFRRTYTGELPSQMSANMQVIQNAQLQLRTVLEALQQDNDQKVKIEQALAQLPPDTPTPDDKTATAAPPPSTTTFDPLVDEATKLGGREAEQQLPRIRAMLRSMELQLKPGHPDIVRLKRIISELERRALTDTPAPSTPSSPGPSREAQLRAELATVGRRIESRQNEEAQLRDVITRYQNRVELTPTRETEFTALMRDYDAIREAYQNLRSKKEDSQLAAELERRSVGETMKVAEPARVPDEPFSPDRRRFVLGGLLAGLLLGTAITIGRELQDKSLRTEDEVVAVVGAPVLAMIPVINSNEANHRARLRLAVAVSAACVLAAVVIMMYIRSGVTF